MGEVRDRRVGRVQKGIDMCKEERVDAECLHCFVIS